MSFGSGCRTRGLFDVRHHARKSLSTTHCQNSSAEEQRQRNEMDRGLVEIFPKPRELCSTPGSERDEFRYESNHFLVSIILFLTLSYLFFSPHLEASCRSSAYASSAKFSTMNALLINCPHARLSPDGFAVSRSHSFQALRRIVISLYHLTLCLYSLCIFRSFARMLSPHLSQILFLFHHPLLQFYTSHSLTR